MYIPGLRRPLDEEELRNRTWALVDEIRRADVDLWPNHVTDFLDSLTAQLDARQLDALLGKLQARIEHKRDYGQWTSRNAA